MASNKSKQPAAHRFVEHNFEIKSRHRPNPRQVRILEAAFKRNAFPCKEYKYQLSQELGLPEATIQVWFQNRRVKENKTNQATMKIESLSDKKSNSLTPGPIPRIELPDLKYLKRDLDFKGSDPSLYKLGCL